MDGTQGTLLSFLPMMIIGAILAVMNFVIGKRKPVNPLPGALVSIIFPIGMFVTAYLAAMTDKAVYDKLDLILESLGKRTR